MSNENRSVRIALAGIFGSGCMFRKSHAEEFIEKLGTIKTYKTFKEEKCYTPKQVRCLEQRMTLHHLKHKSEGGKANLQNGAIINELAHRYMHSLPRNQEEIINDYIREWKRENYGKMTIDFVEEIEQPFDVDMTEMVVEKTKITFKKLSRKQKKQQIRKQKKKEKKEMQKLKKEWEDR